MPELPEVESVRRGLADLVTGARVDTVRVLHPRLLRHQAEGPAGFAGLLTGGGASAVERDLVSFPISYYFAEEDPRFSLASSGSYLLQLAGRGDAEGRPEAVRLRASLLRQAIDDLATTTSARSAVVIRARAAKRSFAMSWPSATTLPLLGTSRPSIMAMVVVLPAPLPPNSPQISPAGRVKERSSTAAGPSGR